MPLICSFPKSFLKVLSNRPSLWSLYRIRELQAHLLRTAMAGPAAGMHVEHCRDGLWREWPISLQSALSDLVLRRMTSSAAKLLVPQANSLLAALSRKMAWRTDNRFPRNFECNTRGHTASLASFLLSFAGVFLANFIFFKSSQWSSL